MASDKKKEVEIVAAAGERQTGIVGMGGRPLAALTDNEFSGVLEEIKRERTRLMAIQREAMVEGVDFGNIPGVDKPTIFQPGAQILNRFAGYVPTYEVKDLSGDGIEKPTVRYVVVCRLHAGDENGPVRAEGVGAANSWERKHRFRTADRVCPECKKSGSILKSRNAGEGFFCWAKRGGCGAKFAENDTRIVDQPLGMIENPDPFDLENTILKMSAKRAYLAATLTAHAASGSFTQDMDEFVIPVASPVKDKKKEPTTSEPAPPLDAKGVKPKNRKEAEKVKVLRDLAMEIIRLGKMDKSPSEIIEGFIGKTPADIVSAGQIDESITKMSEIAGQYRTGTQRAGKDRSEGNITEKMVKRLYAIGSSTLSLLDTDRKFPKDSVQAFVETTCEEIAGTNNPGAISDRTVYDEVANALSEMDRSEKFIVEWDEDQARKAE